VHGLACCFLLQKEEEAEKLVCNISVEVNHLHEGIKLGLVQDREQRVEALGRDALFHGNAAISHLPPYLTVQVGGLCWPCGVPFNGQVACAVLCI
jgi:ubiquitin carboxyl-terminal hydrolase 14